MLRLLKWIAIVLACLVVLIVVLAGVLYGVSVARQRKVYDIPDTAIEIRGDSASIDRGRHLVTAVSPCSECHGADFGGKLLVDDPMTGRLAAPNLTSGQGGIGRDRTDADLARAIRHGVGRDRRSLIYMPSDAFQSYSDEDLGAIVAFLRTLAPIDRSHPAPSVGPLSRILHVAVGFPLLPAEHVDHAARRHAPASGPTREYGAYLADGAGCRSCHGPALAGNANPTCPNVTPGAIGQWSEADFVRALTEGKRPTGDTLSDEMPWKHYRLMTETERQALWEYVRVVPAVAPKKK